MSIEKQKIIRFIPVVNFITAVFWIDLVIKNKIPMKAIIRPLIKSEGAIANRPFRTVGDAGPYNHNIKSAAKSVGETTGRPRKTQ